MELTTTRLVFVNKVPHWHFPNGQFERAQTDSQGKILEKRLYLRNAHGNGKRLVRG